MTTTKLKKSDKPASQISVDALVRCNANEELLNFLERIIKKQPEKPAGQSFEEYLKWRFYSGGYSIDLKPDFWMFQCFEELKIEILRKSRNKNGRFERVEFGKREILKTARRVYQEVNGQLQLI